MESLNSSENSSNLEQIRKKQQTKPNNDNKKNYKQTNYPKNKSNNNKTQNTSQKKNKPREAAQVQRHLKKLSLKTVVFS